MKYTINGFTEGTVDPELQSKLDNDYKSEASECLNFYRDKSGVTRRRAPLRLYRETQFTNVELTNLLDYQKHVDTEYSIQGPSDFYTPHILSFALGEVIGGTPTDLNDALQGTFTRGGITAFYTLDYRVIRYAVGTVKNTYAVVKLSLSADNYKYTVLMYTDQITTEQPIANSYSLGSVEYAISTDTLGAADQTAFANTRFQAMINESVAAGRWVDSQYTELPDELYLFNDRVRATVFDAEFDVLLARNTRYESAIPSTNFRTQDTEGMPATPIIPDVDLDHLHIACMPIVAAADQEVVKMSYRDAIKATLDTDELFQLNPAEIAGRRIILDGQAEAIKAFALHLRDNLAGSTTVLPREDDIVLVSPDVKWSLPNRHGANYFSVIEKNDDYQILTIPEVNYSNSAGWAPLPWGSLTDYAEQFTRVGLSETEWQQQKQEYINKQLRQSNCLTASGGVVGGVGCSLVNRRIEAAADEIYGETFTSDVPDGIALFNERRNLAAAAHGSYRQAPGLVSAFGRGIANSFGQWYGAMALLLMPDAPTDLLASSAAEVPDGLSINTRAPGAITDRNLVGQGYICYVYYDVEKIQEFNKEHYLINGITSSESGSSSGGRPVYNYQLQRTESLRDVNEEQIESQIRTAFYGDSAIIDNVAVKLWRGITLRHETARGGVGAPYRRIAGTPLSNLPQPAWFVARDNNANPTVQGLTLDIAWSLNPTSRAVNGTFKGRQIRYDDEKTYISAATDDLALRPRFGSYAYYYDILAHNTPTGDTERQDRALPAIPPESALSYELNIPEGINTVDFRENLVYITSPTRLRFFPDTELAFNQRVTLRDLMPERGLDTPLSYESTAFYGAQGNQVISFRYYEQSRGYQGRNETKERTLPVITQMQTMIQNHNLIACLAGGTNKLYILCLKENRQTAGFYDQEFDSPIRKFYKLDHDRLLLLFEDGPARVFDLSLKAVSFLDERIMEDGGSEFVPYRSWIASLPIIVIPQSKGFENISHVQVTQAFISMGNAVESFKFRIQSEGESVDVPVRATSAESVDTALKTSLPTVIDYIPPHVMKTPIVGIETSADTDLQFTSIVLELKDKT